MNVVTIPASISRVVLEIGNPETKHQNHEQTRAKPAIDDVICHRLDGEALKEALFVIDNIREHNMKIKWSSINVWAVQYKRKHVCDLRIENDSLHIGQVSGVLAIRVTNMSYDPESIQRLISSLKDSIAGTQELAYAAY